MTLFSWRPNRSGVCFATADVLDETRNHCGRARAMTVFTAIRPWYMPPGGVWLVRLIFWFTRRSLARSGTDLIDRLSFIHFARWGIVDRIPDLGQPREMLRQPLFMFESNYDGTFSEYIDSFGNILTSGMQLFWGTSYGFPTPQPTTRFMDYIRENELVADHYYSAYPTASTTMIVSALALDDSHRAFRIAASTLTDTDFPAALHAFLTNAQVNL